MKKFLLLIIFLMILSLFKVNANNGSFPLINKVIYVDAGHGGVDAGTSYQDILEKDINLQISIKLKDELEKNGAIVYMTRCDDNDLSDSNAIYRKKSDFDNRINLINNGKANMYISIHQNYYVNNIYYGPQVFYSKKIKESANMAEFIQKDLNNFTNTNRKQKIINNIYMYDKLTIPGVLIECGFLSNYRDRNNLTDENYQKEFVKVIVSSISKYFN